MKIDKIKINGFGKIKGKELDLKDGINVIYGENEAGKSTILKFIEAILYGIAKTKNGKSISDFERYKPWDNGEFSGKISYTLENGKSYEVFRDFKKKNPIIYQASEDISKEFHVKQAKEFNFLEQQVGIDETLFCNTAIIGQQEIKLEKTDTNQIVQKISNLVSSGDDNLSFKKSMEQLNKLQNEKIGTERTKEKPINIVNRNIQELSNEKNNLQLTKQKIMNNLLEKEHITDDLTKLEEKKENLKNQKRTLNQDNMKNIETNIKRKIGYFTTLFLIIIVTLLLILFKKFAIAIIPIILGIFNVFAILKMYHNKNQNNFNFDNKIDTEIDEVENTINNLKIKNHILETEKVNLDEKLEELTKIEEELTKQNNIKQELLSLNTSYEIAKECLMKAYEEIKHNLSPKFEQKLCEIASSITNEKYKNVVIHDENGLSIEVENGMHVPVDRLSLGTIDEMYLSLRLSVLAEISKETLPILFDETFSYFDDCRLKNILCYLQDKNYDYQIIIFTCSNREEQMLKELKIEYNLIKLQS